MTILKVGSPPTFWDLFQQVPEVGPRLASCASRRAQCGTRLGGTTQQGWVQVEGTGDTKAVPGQSGAPAKAAAEASPRQPALGPSRGLGPGSALPAGILIVSQDDQHRCPCSPEKRLPARAPLYGGRTQLSRVKKPTERDSVRRAGETGHFHPEPEVPTHGASTGERRP